MAGCGRLINAIKYVEGAVSSVAALTLFGSTISGSLFYIWGHYDRGALAFRIALTCAVWLFVIAVLEKVFPEFSDSVRRRREVDTLLKKVKTDLEGIRRDYDRTKG